MTELRLLSPAEVAKILAIAPSTLCRMRQSGTGPRCVWVTDHTPRYRESDILDYVESKAS